MKLFSVRSTFFSDFFQIFFQNVEHFAHRGTFSWNIFFCVEHFFFLTCTRRGAGPGPDWGKFPTPLYIEPYIKPYILFTEPPYNCYIAIWYNYYILLKNCFCNFKAGASRGVCLLGSEGRSAIRAASNYLRRPTVMHLFFHAATLPEKRPRASFFSHFFRFFFRIFFLQVCALGVLFPHETKSPIGGRRR